MFSDGGTLNGGSQLLSMNPAVQTPSQTDVLTPELTQEYQHKRVMRQ